MTSQTLHRAIRFFDRVLQRPGVRWLQTGDMARLLAEMDRFHRDAHHASAMAEPELTPLIAAGCLISSDLNETIIDQLVDRLQAQDALTAQLSEQLKQTLAQRQKTLYLLREAQNMKRQNQETAQAAGLQQVL